MSPYSPELVHTTPGTGASDIPSVPKMMADTTITQDNRSSGQRNQLTDRQTVFSEHITNMQECQRDAFLWLETMKSSYADMCMDYEPKYVPDYVGLGKYYFRALSNVKTRMTAEIYKLEIGHLQTDRVLDVLKKYQGGSNGKIFHTRKKHCVALQTCPESDAGVFMMICFLWGLVIMRRPLFAWNYCRICQHLCTVRYFLGRQIQLF